MTISQAQFDQLAPVGVHHAHAPTFDPLVTAAAHKIGPWCSPEQFQAAGAGTQIEFMEFGIAMASYRLWTLTNHRYGLVRRTLYPSFDCNCRCSAAACGRVSTPDMLRLPGRIGAIEEVWCDGVHHPGSEFRIDRRRRHVAWKDPSASWWCCNDTTREAHCLPEHHQPEATQIVNRSPGLGLFLPGREIDSASGMSTWAAAWAAASGFEPAAAPPAPAQVEAHGTPWTIGEPAPVVPSGNGAPSWAVTYWAGRPVPELAQQHAALLAVYYAAQQCLASGCAIPPNVQQITRVGVTIKFDDSAGKPSRDDGTQNPSPTPFRSINDWLNSAAPKRQRRGRAISPVRRYEKAVPPGACGRCWTRGRGAHSSASYGYGYYAPVDPGRGRQVWSWVEAQPVPA